MCPYCPRNHFMVLGKINLRVGILASRYYSFQPTIFYNIEPV